MGFEASARCGNEVGGDIRNLGDETEVAFVRPYRQPRARNEVSSVLGVRDRSHRVCITVMDPNWGDDRMRPEGPGSPLYHDLLRIRTNALAERPHVSTPSTQP